MTGECPKEGLICLEVALSQPQTLHPQRVTSSFRLGRALRRHTCAVLSVPPRAVTSYHRRTR